jgi:hypothetical protein
MANTQGIILNITHRQGFAGQLMAYLHFPSTFSSIEGKMTEDDQLQYQAIE